MNRRPLALGALFAVALIGAFLLLSPGRNRPAPPLAPPPASTLASPVQNAAAAPPAAPAHSAPRAEPRAPAALSKPAAFNPAEFPIAAALNAPDSTITRDLDLLQQLFDAWRTNFPREGNPVGENADITAALLGENRLGLALVPKGHPALNARGELCDRWGTPFRFHQLSGEKMEVRSAGPDRRFASADDAIWTPQ
jgi:hypothetical protein